MKIEKNRILLASALAVIGLVAFQLIWMRYSQRMSEEIFNQRVSMALCSAVQNYGNGVLCQDAGCAAACGVANITDSSVVLSTDLANNPDFRAEIRRALDFYQINLDYQLNLSSVKQASQNGYQCAVTLPISNTQKAVVNMVFPEKEAFILSNMKFMVGATVLILIFITAVLMLANWSLMKQKRLLQTNVDFFNNMAHEFRTPLSNIRLAVNMLTKKHQDLQDNSLVEVIRRENTHLIHEVERVLHLASLENGDYALTKEVLPLKNLLQSVMDSLTMPIAERQAQIRFDTVAEDFNIYGDRQHLGNVFRNLIDNALKYTLARPEICVTAKKNANGVLISVQDNGIGIPQAQKALIFEKFQRLNTQYQQNQKGFGLGLAYVKSMIELHKGSIRVSSEEHKGSRFDIFLPNIS
jgi:two-component system, OmpR family, phosphate regulon sensor histidine kinase PhoR